MLQSFRSATGSKLANLLAREQLLQYFHTLKVSHPMSAYVLYIYTCIYTREYASAIPRAKGRLPAAAGGASIAINVLGCDRHVVTLTFRLSRTTIMSHDRTRHTSVTVTFAQR